MALANICKYQTHPINDKNQSTIFKEMNRLAMFKNHKSQINTDSFGAK